MTQNYLIPNTTPKKRELTEKDHAFLATLFDEAAGNIAVTGRILGIANPYGIFARLEEEIIDRARHIIALNSVRAAHVLAEGLDPSATISGPAQSIRMQCAEKILDRVGIVKKEKIDINLEGTTGIFILPPKRSENEYVRATEEQAKEAR